MWWPWKKPNKKKCPECGAWLEYELAGLADCMLNDILVWGVCPSGHGKIEARRKKGSVRSDKYFWRKMTMASLGVAVERRAARTNKDNIEVGDSVIAWWPEGNTRGRVVAIPDGDDQYWRVRSDDGHLWLFMEFQSMELVCKKGGE